MLVVETSKKNEGMGWVVDGVGFRFLAIAVVNSNQNKGFP